jgi:frataxin-like iron-binding protein CyaY
LRSVGSKECLDDDRLAFTKQDWINRRGKEFWKHITEEFSRSDLEDLFRGLVIAERELNWMGGSAASAIWVFDIYKLRFENTFTELADWALKNRGSNLYVPFGGKTYSSRYNEWVDENQCKEERYREHLREQISEQKEKIFRQEKRLECQKTRLINGEVRAKMVKEHNERLSSVDIIERLELIVYSDMPLESVDNELLKEAFGKSLVLDSKIIDNLLGKIDRRDSGSWGKIKRTLLSRQ